MDNAPQEVGWADGSDVGARENGLKLVQWWKRRGGDGEDSL